MSLKVLVYRVFHGFAIIFLNETAGTDPVKKQKKWNMGAECSLPCFKSPKHVVEEHLNKSQGEKMR